MKRTCILAMLMAVCAAASVWNMNAREIPMWPYDRLQHEADLVILGHALQAEDSGEVVHAQLWQTDFVGVNTTFQVNGVIDGRYRESEITVFTLRLPYEKILTDGPRMVTFQTKKSTPGLSSTVVTRTSVPEYLLFLKKRDDGRYEPVSGPLDARHAVREVFVPASAR